MPNPAPKMTEPSKDNKKRLSLVSIRVPWGPCDDVMELKGFISWCAVRPHRGDWNHNPVPRITSRVNRETRNLITKQLSLFCFGIDVFGRDLAARW